MPLNHTSQYSELTDEHFSLIGRVVVEWSNVEFLLGGMLSRLLFTPEFPGRVFSRGMGAARLQRAIEDALELQELRYRNIIVSEDLASNLRRMNKKLNVLRQTRNKFAHFAGLVSMTMKSLVQDFQAQHTVRNVKKKTVPVSR
ncbi:hypothetical protein [Rheinheimera faecalis]